MTEVDIRVLLVELDAGDAKASLAAGAGLVVSSTSSFEDAGKALAAFHPNAVVVGMGPPSTGALTALEAFLEAAHPVPVMVVLPALEERVAVRLIKRGIRGLILAQDVRFLPTSVRELLRGGTPMSPPVSRLVLQRARRSSSRLAAVRPPSEGAPQLSQRQREILGFLQRGYSYDDIGTALNLSVNTVRSHVRVIYERLGAASKVEAVMIGLQHGLL